MALSLQIFLIIGIILYFVFIVYFLKKKALSLKYSLLWLLTGTIMLVVALFPQTMNWISAFLGIESIVNTVFALQLFFQMVILMSITSVVSKQNDKEKKIIQTLALIEKRVRELESKERDEVLH